MNPGRNREKGGMCRLRCRQTSQVSKNLGGLLMTWVFENLDVLLSGAQKPARPSLTANKLLRFETQYTSPGRLIQFGLSPKTFHEAFGGNRTAHG